MGDQDVIIDLVDILFDVLVRRQQEPVEIVLILSPALADREARLLINIENGGFTDCLRLRLSH